MPSLRIRKNDRPVLSYRLDREKTVIGKAPDCDIRLPEDHVSKCHAMILRRPDGYYIVDLESTNHTKLDGERLPAGEARHLVDGHAIKICEYTLEYFDGEPEPDEGPPILETIDILSASGAPLAVAHAEAKLGVIMRISEQLVGVLDLSAVLAKVLEELFRIFPQAERGLLVFRDERTDALEIKASQFRHPDSGRSFPSRTVYDHVTREGQAILCEDITADDRFSAVRSLERSRVRTMMCVPLWDHRRRAVGILQLDTRARGSRFTQADLDFLAALASTLSLAVANARLHEWDVLEERGRQEARDAREVQRSLIPSGHPDLPGYAFWHHYDPAHSVGGDYFDYRPIPGPDAAATAGPARRWAVAIGDVAGKGMPAALVMVRLATEVRLLVQAEPDPVRLVSRLNRSLCEVTPAERFATFILAVLDGARHELVVVNAGHPPAMIRRADGRIEWIGQASVGLPLGIQAEATYAAEATPIGRGDVVVLYTDGVDSSISSNHELFGTERVARSIAEAPPGIVAVGEALRDAVYRHAAGCAQFDDITILGFGRP